MSYHINPETGRENICRATEKRGCQYKNSDGTTPPHFETKEAAREYSAKIAEKENELFKTVQKQRGADQPKNIISKEQLKKSVEAARDPLTGRVDPSKLTKEEKEELINLAAEKELKASNIGKVTAADKKKVVKPIIAEQARKQKEESLRNRLIREASIEDENRRRTKITPKKAIQASVDPYKVSESRIRSVINDTDHYVSAKIEYSGCFGEDCPVGPGNGMSPDIGHSCDCGEVKGLEINKDLAAQHLYNQIAKDGEKYYKTYDPTIPKEPTPEQRESINFIKKSMDEAGLFDEKNYSYETVLTRYYGEQIKDPTVPENVEIGGKIGSSLRELFPKVFDARKKL